MNNENKEHYAQMDQVNVRVTADLNDWLNDTVKLTKRQQGSKVPKECIIIAALLLLQKQNLDWANIKNQQDLLQTLGVEE